MEDHVEINKRMKGADEAFSQGSGNDGGFGGSMVNDEEDQMNANIIHNADLPLDSEATAAAEAAEAEVSAQQTGAAPAAAATKAKKPRKPKVKEPHNEEVVPMAKGSEKDKEFEVPLAAINKILKAALPEGAVCTKDAKSAFSKAAGIFVLYITACANDMARANKRTTITAQDITSALTELGYGSFTPHLEVTLEKMKQEAAARKSLKESTKKKPEEEPAQQNAAPATSASSAISTTTPE